IASQGSRSDGYLLGDVVKTGICAMPGKRFLRHVENPFAIPLRIRAGLSRDAFCVFLGHNEKTCNRRQSPVILYIAETLSVLFELGRLVNTDLQAPIRASRPEGERI